MELHDPVSTQRPRTQPPTALARSLMGVFIATFLLGLLSTPLSAQIVLDSPVEEFPPTSEDLNGVASAPSGEIIAIGNGATVLRRTTDPDGNPMWSSLAAWSAGFFTAELFDIAHSPVSYPDGPAWVIAGRGGVVETDFTNTMEVDLVPGSNKIFTPVLPTEDEIWYGVPDLGTFPSFLHRYDRSTQEAPGIAFPVGAVLAMCQVPGGDLRYVTTDGDIEEIDDGLQVTTLFDQPVGQPLELNAASFSEDCEVISAGDAGPESRIYAGFIEALSNPREPEQGPSFVPWRHVSRPGEPAVTSTSFLSPNEHRRLVGYFSILMRCNDNVPTGDEATMSAFADFLDSHIDDILPFNSQTKCQRGATTRPVTSLRRESHVSLAPTFVTDFEVITVGTQGRVQRIAGGRKILFSDDFETGDVSRWSFSTP
ncbi:MAG: hypothetical protein K0U98_25755 [Deltaproteobacteria bacterium]|nr:hypothetical protein [Deltaproteobacteria bacterium]